MNSGIKLKNLLFTTMDDKKVVLARIIVGLIFLSEGIQKFLFPGTVGTARFEKIGFDDPAFWSGFTATFEIVCGAFVLLGFLTRIASVPLLIIMLTAFVTTKWPLLIHKGIWVMAHEYRTDFAMTLLLVYLLIAGGGRCSLDLKFFQTVRID